MILFSVITVSYNSAEYLNDTIKSVLKQSYTDFEYILGDDNSTDCSWDIIQSFEDSRIKRYRNTSNLGEYANREKALSLASGRYVIFIDGDDIMYAHALETFRFYTDAFPECSMLFMRPWDPRILPPYKISPRDIYRFEFLDKSVIGGNFTNVVFKSDVIKKEIFPTGIRTGDTYIQLKIAQNNDALIIPDGQTWWRRRTGNATELFFSSGKHMAETISYRLELLGAGCPLTDEEIEQARRNIYGIYLRQLLRMVTTFQLSDVGYLIRSIKVPARYFLEFFIPSKHSLFRDIKGDKPLHTEIEKHI